MAIFDATVHEIAPTFWIAEVPQVKFDVVRLVRGLFPLGKTDLGLKGAFYCRSGRVIETHEYVVLIVERNNLADATLSRHDHVQDCSLPGAHARSGARHRTRQ